MKLTNNKTKELNYSTNLNVFNDKTIIKNYNSIHLDIEHKIDLYKTLLNDKYNQLVFDKDNHEYSVDGYSLNSTTRFIDEFKTPFDKYSIAEFKFKSEFKKNPQTTKTASYYRERWKLLGEEAATIGSRIHHFAEAFPYFESPVCDKEQGIIDFFNNLDEKYVVLHSEFRMYDEEYSKAGTCDAILLNTETDKLVIIDWKTGGKSIFEYDKHLKGDFKDYVASKYNEYSIQLSHYKYMLEKKGFEVEDMWLIWLVTRNDAKSIRNKVLEQNKKKLQVVKSIELSDNYRVFKCKDMSKILTQYFANNHDKMSTKVKSESSGAMIDVNALMESLTVNPFIPKKQPVSKKNKINLFSNDSE